MLHKTNMALGSQLPIRLDPETDKRLQAAAEQAGTTKSAVIRMLAKTFVDQCVTPAGKVTLPPDWHELLPARDGRSDSMNFSQRVSGKGNKVQQNVFSSASDSPAPKPVSRKKAGKSTRKGRT